MFGDGQPVCHEHVFAEHVFAEHGTTTHAHRSEGGGPLEGDVPAAARGAHSKEGRPREGIGVPVFGEHACSANTRVR